MGVLGKDLLDFHRPRTNTKVEFGASGYWVESHPTMQPYGAVLTEILNLDAAPFQELLDQYRKTVAEKDAEQAARAFQAVTNGFASLPIYRLYWNDVHTNIFLKRLMIYRRCCIMKMVMRNEKIHFHA